MALRITDCKATSSAVQIFFSDAVNTAATGANFGSSGVNAGNYLVTAFLAAGSQTIALTQPGSADSSQRSVTFILPLISGQSLPVGTWLTIVASRVTIASDPGGTPINTNGIDNTIAVQINGGVSAGAVTQAVEDAVSYPLLTEQVSFPSSPGPGGITAGPTAAAGGMALGQTAARALGDVLGWKVNASDPRGFVGALNQAFTLTEVEGHVEATWTPRTYAVQTDLGGGITGAQASLYTRAKQALEQSLPLLDGLYPLDPEADAEDVKALREMARSQMTEIVNELGSLGGPSVLRVNTYFSILLGQKPIVFQPPTQVVFNPDSVTGTLGSLRDTYGIFFTGNPFSNSIEDEQDITNFRVISDYMTSLLQSWISNGQFFTLGPGTQTAFFGTQLVLISRQFSVIAETVNEVRFALDSVFIGPSERQTLLLQFADPNLPSMFVEDFLHEVEQLVTTEGPRLIQDGGRLAVNNNILPVVISLEHLADQARNPTNLGTLPDGYRTARVQRTLDDLDDQLSDLINLARPVGRDVPPPEVPPQALSVVNVAPASISFAGSPIAPATVTIFGTGFAPGAIPLFVPTPGAGVITVKSTTFLSTNLLVVTISPSTRGMYNVTVSNPDGKIASPLGGGLTVTP
jgi:hypothetical protein